MTSQNITNKLYGAVYDYIENTALNAYPFTAKPGSIKPILHFNQYGFTPGGPIFIPHLYNGRDKTFFFGSYEKLNQTGQGSGISSVLTPVLEAGDFSAYGGTFYDPTTGLPYTNNQIPASQPATANAAIAKKYEADMVAPNLCGILNNLNSSCPSDIVIKQSIDRIDENIDDKIKLFGRYYGQDLTFVSGTSFATNASNGPTNLAVFKDFAVGEWAKIQFRSEAFNLFNHPSGANPSSGGIGINTGTSASDPCRANACLVFNPGFGQITSVQSVPGTFSGARVLELSGKITF